MGGPFVAGCGGEMPHSAARGAARLSPTRRLAAALAVRAGCAPARRAVVSGAESGYQGRAAGGFFCAEAGGVVHASSLFFLARASITNACEFFAGVRNG